MPESLVMLLIYVALAVIFGFGAICGADSYHHRKR